MRYLLALTLTAVLAMPAFAEYNHRLPDSGSKTDSQCNPQLNDDDNPSTDGMASVDYKFTIKRTSETEGSTTVRGWLEGRDMVDDVLVSTSFPANWDCTIIGSGINFPDPVPDNTRSHLIATGDMGHFEDIVYEYSLIE